MATRGEKEALRRRLRAAREALPVVGLAPTPPATLHHPPSPPPSLP